MSGNNIKVVVRCRPLNAREKARGAVPLIRMEGNKTIISKPASPGSKVLEDPKAFTFDESYWSADKNDPDYADQERVYNDLGKEVLDHAFNGYNCCIFAYGQTGSGKSYSMVGYGEEKGIIPRACSELFDRVDQNRTDTKTFQVEVSYIEIYNEKVRDLLNPNAGGNLKVREHPTLGPYVQDLSRLAVSDYKSLDQLMDEGNKARTVAATNMNETSSRSHAVFTIFVTQKVLDPTTKQVTEKVARISLVDLAGSERANSTGATGVRLKEGANINKSLTTLGKVIAGLAEQAQAGDKKGKKGKEAFVPFRDSVLTWLLKDSLGGNSKTCMIAAISPADYDETLSTLRYADQAKKIKTKAVVNEDPNAKIMRELKDEVEALRQALMVYAPEEVEKIAVIAHPVKGSKAPAKASAAAAAKPTVAVTASNNKSEVKHSGCSKKHDTKSLTVPEPVKPTSSKSTVVFTDASGNITQLTKDEMVEQLKTTEKLLSGLNQTWEEKLKEAETVHVEREKALQNLGITIEKNQVGLYTPKETPYLINLNEDPLMSECLMYNLKPGFTYVDQIAEDAPKEHPTGGSYIRLSGSNISNDHCYFENKENVVTLYPRPGCTAMVNGMRISEPRVLKTGYRIILGDHHVFRFNNPGEVLKQRESMQLLDTAAPPSPTLSDKEPIRPTTPGPEIVDWNFARREAMLNTYINDSSFDNFTNEDIDKLFDDVAKIRIIRKRQSNCSEMSHRTSSTSSARFSRLLDDSLDGYCTSDTSSISSVSSFENNLMVASKSEQEIQLDHYRRKYEAKLRRLSRHISFTQPPPIQFSPREKELASKVAEHWKRQRNVAMAKTILTYDGYLSQANALAEKAQKQVFYQFAVVEDNISVMAVSHWDSSSGGSQPKSTIDPELIKTPKPCIAVQVVDKRHQAIYLWSIEKFMTRLRFLQGAFYLSDSKRYTKGDDLYYESTTPTYALAGLAKMSLRNLSTQVPVENQLSVYCRDTGRLMGQLKVLIAPIARSVRYRAEEPEIEDENPRKLLHVGQQLVFEISILSLTGLDPAEFSLAHAQFRLSTFGPLEGVFASEAVQVTANITFDYHQTISMAITQEVLKVIETEDIVFEVYGKPHQKHLETIKMSPVETVEALPIKQSDDVIARIQICEITGSGDYKPVPIESSQTDILGQYDTFSLQQGQQRRLVLSLQGALDKILDIRVGQIRLVDNKHRTISNGSMVDVPLSIISSKDLRAEASWDSSLHDTALLNAVTSNLQKVAMTVTWTVRQKLLLNGNEVDQLLKFEKDVFVHIKDQNKAANLKKKGSRPKRTSVIMNFFSVKPTNIKSQVTALYSVSYRPEMFGQLQELPQKGPAAILLDRYKKQRETIERQLAMDRVKYSIFLAEQLDRLCGPEKVQTKLDLKTVLDLWQKKPIETPVLDQTKVIQPIVRKWIPRVEQVIIPITEEVSKFKKGFLLRKNDSNSNEWDKYWCILAGHYLFLYPDQFEVNEIDILNIRNVHKVKTYETMKSKTLFTVDTLYDSHTFQAPDNATMLEWVSMFD